MHLVHAIPKMNLSFATIAIGLVACIYCESQFGTSHGSHNRHTAIDDDPLSRWSGTSADDPTIASPGSHDQSTPIKFRHRKGSGADGTMNTGHKKHSIRQRGQRHRNNKNGKLLSASSTLRILLLHSRQQINFIVDGLRMHKCQYAHYALYGWKTVSNDRSHCRRKKNRWRENKRVAERLTLISSRLLCYRTKPANQLKPSNLSIRNMFFHIRIQSIQSDCPFFSAALFRYFIRRTNAAYANVNTIWFCHYVGCGGFFSASYSGNLPFFPLNSRCEEKEDLEAIE